MAAMVSTFQEKFKQATPELQGPQFLKGGQGDGASLSLGVVPAHPGSNRLIRYRSGPKPARPPRAGLLRCGCQEPFLLFPSVNWKLTADFVQARPAA